MKRFRFSIEAESKDEKKWWYIVIDYDYDYIYFGPYITRSVARFHKKRLDTVMNSADAAEVTVDPEN